VIDGLTAMRPDEVISAISQRVIPTLDPREERAK
jgi:hypothetical protein